MNGALPFGDFPARIILGFSKVFLDDPHAFDDNTLFSGNTARILPEEPRKFPEMTSTWSPFLT